MTTEQSNLVAIQPLARGTGPVLVESNPVRTGLFISIAIALYVVANLFGQFLLNGSWISGLNLSLGSYRQALTTPLGEIFFRPLSIFHYPWMIVVWGFLLAVIIFLPIAVAVMYRMIWIAPFIAIAGLIGHAPALAMTLAVSCMLAGLIRLRGGAPLLAVMLALGLVGLHLCLVSFTGGDSAPAAPLQRWVPYAPFAVAMAATLAAMFVSLGLARLTRYQPGVLCPPTLAMLAVALGLFYSRVGPAELDYALIAGEFADAGTFTEPTPLPDWQRRHRAEGLSQDDLINRIRDDLDTRRRAVTAQCDRYLSRYGDETRSPAIAYIKAQAQSFQLDSSAIELRVVQYIDRYLLDSSRRAWTELADRYPNSSQAVIAQCRLAELDLRDNNPAQADRRLRLALPTLSRDVEQRQQNGDSESTRVFSPLPSHPPASSYDAARQRALWLRWMMDRNGIPADPDAAEAFAAMLGVDHTQPDYGLQLGRLLNDPQHPRENTRLGHNILVAIAKAHGDLHRRIPQLTLLAEDLDHADADAAVEANFELGRLAMVYGDLVRQGILKLPEEYFRLVVAAPDSPWLKQAKEWLGKIPVTQP